MIQEDNSEVSHGELMRNWEQDNPQESLFLSQLRNQSVNLIHTFIIPISLFLYQYNFRIDLVGDYLFPGKFCPSLCTQDIQVGLTPKFISHHEIMFFLPLFYCFHNAFFIP